MSRTTPMESSEPVWELAELFPHQGAWSEEDYLALETTQLIEYSHGQLEVLTMPTISHQRIVSFLNNLLIAFLGRFMPEAVVLFAPLRVRLWPGKFREPDVVVVLSRQGERMHEQYMDPPDLVMEVVSADYRRLDLEIKRREYAQAGIPEYWIVDPEAAQITVLALQDDHYVVHGVFSRGDTAKSVLLNNFEVVVDEVWAAAHL